MYNRFPLFWQTLLSAYANWSKDGGSLLAGSVAYFTAVAFFPLLLVLLSLFGWFLAATQAGKDAEAYVLEAVGDQFSPVLQSQVETVFAQVRAKASRGGPVGFITFLAIVTALFVQVDTAFARIWNVRQAPIGWWGTIKNVLVLRLRAFIMLVGLMTVIVVVFVSGMALTTVEEFMGARFPVPPGAFWTIQLVVSVLLNSGVFTLIYYFLPNTHVPWRAAAAGGLFAGIVWEIGRQLLATYIIGQRYDSAYGVIGAFLAIMFWVYYAGTVLFFGAEVAQAVCQRLAPSRCD